MSHPLLNKDGGERHLLLGNEAIVRGALEAGVAFVSCYPGTPSSEVPDTFFRLSPDGDYTFEYSVNEKVALEVGGGAALAGAPTLVTMKHVGVNVAADPLMTLAYIGTPGGLVLLSADDPGCHSSQNEQDNRYYARIAGMPVFEPSSAQEAKDMTRDAFELSRRFEQPVMLRTTTRVAHLRGPVDFGPRPGALHGPDFTKNPGRFVPVPAVSRARHIALLENLTKIREAVESSPWNTVSGNGEVGVVASGMARAYVADVLDEERFSGRFRVLNLGLTYPLPEEKLANFLREVRRVLVVEEGEPLVEQALRAIAQERGIDVEIVGKGKHLTRLGEYCTRQVRLAVADFVGETDATASCPAPEKLPMRPPNLCAGCSHRALYYTIRQAYGDNAVYSSDIGCYTLGLLPPLSAADFLLCMGSSVSAGCGFAKAQDKPVVGFIGDSTFFHSGITGLVNAVYNRHDILLVILDNRTTAMTGHQPNPGVDTTIHGENPSKVDIETIVRGCGVEHIRRVSPYNFKKTMAAVEELKALPGVRVLIAEEPCVLFARRTLRKARPNVAYVAEQTEAVTRCLTELACPAFRKDGDEVAISEHQCAGCMFCMQICPDIKARKRSQS
ncbi:indolepyruvate ferredoxin oxidoreductase alpha subunit [Desulfobaculum xiamenense]|uniref:Indolepyruvate oxidoreductase subunit IorA n=1 Tax=Desulfobaculum xiamenense TaxID=995050 RepID=A0A846QGQ1_9BACT|nr:indolepyruvate ferredoxin oxidoreductase subunit alpha [Desulfobaculum xiamenense]NJB67411.1 indolepyruvate ferredoxin oxidoreductase alpha subunit [Desulfobaculum xiamenense]